MTRRQHKGFYVALEGGDGSGKGTQAKELIRELRARGYNVLATDYPQYGEASARYVERYLNGVYGKADAVHPDLAALTYVIDRLNSKTLQAVRKHLETPGNIVVSNRSPASNMAHQATKISSRGEREEFYKEIAELEYEILNEPRPDLNIVLRVNATVAQQNVDKKDHSTHAYTTAKRDIHEADADHLTKALRDYNELCETLPNEFTSIEALNEQGDMRPIEEVHHEIMLLLEVHGLLSPISVLDKI